MRGKCVFPGRDCSSAEDGCSPDEMNYCVYYLIIIIYDQLKCQLAGGTLHVYKCIIELLLYEIGLSANSQEALSTYINVLLNYYCIRSALVPTLRRHSPGLWEPNKPYQMSSVLC